MALGNKTIGRFHLDGIPPAPRGIPQVEVTFDIDANGILNVSAKDKGTGREQKIRIEASSGLSDDEIRRMREEAKANESADKVAREKADKVNAADSMIFQTEKQLKEFGDKIPVDKKGRIENALGQLREAQKSQDVTPLTVPLPRSTLHGRQPPRTCTSRHRVQVSRLVRSQARSQAPWEVMRPAARNRAMTSRSPTWTSKRSNKHNKSLAKTVSALSETVFCFSIFAPNWKT